MPIFLSVAWLSAVMVAQHGGSCACQVEMWTHIQPGYEDLAGRGEKFSFVNYVFASHTEKRIKV